MLQDLYERGEIYRSEYDGWYCVACERFFTEKDIIDGKCPEPNCGKPVDPIREANYFFRMSKYQEWLIDYINTHTQFIQPDFRRNETLGFLKNKLQDLCISRPKSRLSWGIELPFDRDFVTYVWFDALVNYISAIGYLSDEQKFKRWWPANIHLIGKDILTTHTVYWPTMLKAVGLPMPKTIFAHGWWLSGKDKMSKSKGNVVNPMDYIDKFGVDAFRYFLIAEMVLGQDASFTEEVFLRRYNSDLANDLGNLVSRIIKIIVKNCGGIVKKPVINNEGNDEAFLRTTVVNAASYMLESIPGMRIDQGIAALCSAVKEANRYLEKTQPWTLAKENKVAELNVVMYYVVESLRIISELLYPVMPAKMFELRESLGLGKEPVKKCDLQWGITKTVNIKNQSIILFPKFQETSAGGEGEEKKVEGVMQIEYADFQKIELRTARIIEASKVEGADKLLLLQIEIAGEKRQIVAGIAKHYKPEELTGKIIVVVSNLKPAKIRKIESNGMLLAASSGEVLRLITVDGEIASGAVVK